MYRGIVFDLDGTLLDSKLCFDSIRKQLEIPHGKLILEYLEKIPTAQRTIKHKRLHEIELNAAKSAPLFPGVATLINALNASGIKLGIFTRNNRQVTEWVVNQYRLPIDLIISRDDAPPKPNPQGLKFFTEHWKLQHGHVLFVGDSSIDLQCGKNAGISTALFQDMKTNNNLTADIYFQSFSQLHKIIIKNS